MNERHQFLAAVLEVFRRLDRDAPSPDVDLFETGVLDSVGFVELLAALEQEFGCLFELDDLEIDNFRSVRAIAAFVGGSRGGELDRPAESA
jgi:acyl carrier protein